MAAFKVGASIGFSSSTRFGDLVVLVGDGVNQFRERGLGAFLMFRREFL